MGIKRIVDVDFWNDDKVLEMFSPEDKLFMLYLLTNPHTTQLGIYAINIKHFAFELGYSTDTIRVLLDRFENKYKIIKYDYKTKEVAIRNFLVFSIIKGGKPVFDCLERELKDVKSTDLITYVYENLLKKRELNKTVADFLDVLKEKSNKKENNDNHNDNDNDNDVSYHDSLDDSLDDSLELPKPKKKRKTKIFEPPTLEEVAAYCMERKNTVNPKDFYDYYSVGNWVDSNGNKIKNWKQKLLTWENRQKTQQKPSQNTGNPFFDLLREEGKM